MERTVRRLAAVLAADVVGYSGKIEADESSTLAALKDVRAKTIDPLLAENSVASLRKAGAPMCSQRETCRLPEAPASENLRRRARQASSPVIQLVSEAIWRENSVCTRADQA